MSHTYVLLPVSDQTYEEISKAFEAAEYTHAFHRHDGKDCIDMHGVALVRDDGVMFNIVRHKEAQNGGNTSS